MEYDVIMEGDAIKILSTLPTSTADLFVVDPPYGVDKANWDKFSLSWLDECYRILKPTGTIYVFGSVWWYPLVHVHMLKIGFIPRNMLVWFYENAMARQEHNFVMQYDPIGFFTKSDDYIFNTDDIRVPYKSTERLKYPINKDGKTWKPNPLGKKCGNVIDIPALAGAHFAEERTKHPTQKPLALIKLLIRASSRIDDLIIDPFVGSGTTAVGAKQLSRHYIGIDNDHASCEIANRRLTSML